MEKFNLASIPSLDPNSFRIPITNTNILIKKKTRINQKILKSQNMLTCNAISIELQTINKFIKTFRLNAPKRHINVVIEILIHNNNNGSITSPISESALNIKANKSL